MCGVLIRFRMHFIAILADTKKAFLQIGIQENERDVTRFLWFEDPTNQKGLKEICLFIDFVVCPLVLFVVLSY